MNEQQIEKGKLKAENFTYWLQGFAEVTEKCPTPKQWKIITEHLEMCFDRVYQESRKEDLQINTISSTGFLYTGTSLGFGRPTPFTGLLC